ASALAAILLLPLVTAPAACAAATTPADPPPAADQAPAGHAHDATVHHGFEDAERWAKVFDAPDRDAWQKPATVIEALGLKPGMIVADLGAGTGYFEARLSKAVAPGGLVLEIDPEPDMVRYLSRRAVKDGLANVLPILALPEEPFLPGGRV